jgi:hypothetical protein
VVKSIPGRGMAGAELLGLFLVEEKEEAEELRKYWGRGA